MRKIRVIYFQQNLAIGACEEYLWLLMEGIDKRAYEVMFVCPDAGALESELKILIRQKALEDYFIFTGYRNDIPRLLSAFEILVMPSLFEGLCFAVIEASAMGVPVIAACVGGMSRSVADGKTGMLVPPSDAAALAKAILWMLSHHQEAQ